MLTDVVCISCPNVAGSLAKVLDYLAAENIFIEYMYALLREIRHMWLSVRLMWSDAWKS